MTTVTHSSSRSISRTIAAVCAATALTAGVLGAAAAPALAAFGFTNSPTVPFAKLHQPVGGVTPSLGGGGSELILPTSIAGWVGQFQSAPDLTQAGGHPDFTSGFFLNKVGSNPDGKIRDALVDTPAGFFGDPLATPRCTDADFYTQAVGSSGLCVPNQQVGLGMFAGPSNAVEPIYNIAPPAGAPAAFAFKGLGQVFFFTANFRPDGSYGLRSSALTLNTGFKTTGAMVTIWGVPADPVHDPQRVLVPGPVKFGAQASAQPAAFLSNSTSCSGPLSATLSADAWDQNPGSFLTANMPLPAMTGCDAVPFDPDFSLLPTIQRAESPSGVDVDLQVPQGGTTDPNGLATAHLKKTVVTLPEGMSLNPGAADGLAACTEAQIGMISESPLRFDANEPTCPDGSKVGTATVTTPALADPLQGTLYVADQNDNPFHTLLSGYLVVEDKVRGVLIKVAGRFDTDPHTGRITATFDDNPQAPFSDLVLHFKSGDRGVLAMPPTCGQYTIDSQLVPWSAADPDNPTPDEIVGQSSNFTVNQSPGGGACQTGDPNQPGNPADRGARPFSPQLSAGTVSPLAGHFTPFTLRLTRQDGEQEISGVSTTLPPGLLGKLAGVAECSDDTIAAIPTALGTGQGELNSPSCPAGSQVGTATVGAGVGATPFFLKTSKAYLAGPYKGAPYSLAVVTPAVAGPFDLGNVVTRVALNLDPTTAQISAASDPLPTILDGIPLHVRDIRVDVDRPNFTLTGTSCNQYSIDGTVNGASTILDDPSDDVTTAVSQRYQLGECSSLAFKPRFKVSLKGGTKRNGHPAFTTTIAYPQGAYANLAKAVVTLPKQMQLDQSHIQAPCTRPQFAAGQCPDASVIGTVTATSPLVDYPITGPVYLRTGSNPLPDVVLDLHGPAAHPVHFVQVGKIDTVNARLRTTFDTVPDAPLSNVVVSLVGGSKGLLVNNSSLCAQKDIASIQLDGHNGKVADSDPAVKVAGCKAPRKKHKHHKRHHRRHHARHGAR